MLETALVTFSTLFATVGPIESAALFAMLTPSMSKSERRNVAIKATAIATAILLFFAVLGELILRQLGVSNAALEAAGGLILLLIAMDMVFARKSGGLTATALEYAEAENKAQIWVAPLATPIIAGPGAMAGAALVGGRALEEPLLYVPTLIVLTFTMVITLAILMVAVELREWLSDIALNIVTRVMGIMLAALAVQFMFNGIKTGLVTI